MTQQPTTIPEADTVQLPQPDPEREQRLTQREQAVALRERQLKAREELDKLGLPHTVAQEMDLHSDEGLARGLRLAALLKSLPPAPPAAPPKAHRALKADKHISYRALADMYYSDPANYQQQLNSQQY